ncbi:MAG: VCBS repeat-containing protein [Pirellulales bacterium]|nr:VCBS repeat-containing protein [Pirellulales bacterium]
MRQKIPELKLCSLKLRSLLSAPAMILSMATAAAATGPSWTCVSTKTGALETPNSGRQQTASLVLDVDRDGTDDFVITERSQAPSVVWYKHQGNGHWVKYTIDDQPLHIEAGGDSFDIDGDGDLDVVFCGDFRDDGVWWWENPHPDHQPKVPWKRRTIKSGDDARYQHDSRFGDFDDDGKAEFAWWSQTARRLYLAEVPESPRAAGAWKVTVIFTYSSGPGHEGMDVADMNLDGKVDIVGAGYWFEHAGGTKYVPHRISARANTRTAVGQIVPGDRPEVVLSPGDSDGPLEWFRWDGRRWVAHRLADLIIHGHSLQVADIDGDGHLDVFSGEMGQPGAGKNCKTRIFWGDGKGDLREEVIAVGKAHHESKLGDFDGDGDLDLLGKPYSFEAPCLHLWLQSGVR